MTNLAAKTGQWIDFARMKIDESCRDLKRLLEMPRLMYKYQDSMEKMLALLFLVYAICLLVGEGLRDRLHGQPVREREAVPERERLQGAPFRKKGKKWNRYSGLFILLKQK